MNVFALILGAVLTTAGKDGVTLSVSSETAQVNPAESVFLRVELVVPSGRSAELPDLRDRVKGFSLAEDFAEEPVTAADGSVTKAANWRLVPEPCAEIYKVKPFAVQADGGRVSFGVGPVYFENPPKRDPVTGEMEADPKKDLPPLSWKLVGRVAIALVALAAVVVGLWLLVRTRARKVNEQRMSPIERAWVELDRLLKKGLPGRGRYKDFYVELTMVVRRYVQRKYGIRAPHLTTEEFFAELARTERQTAEQTRSLRKFLESADMVKFAGVEATPEMADEATGSARVYLKGDAQEEKRA